jgi:Holliday junction resolvase RusA-like endonuclease
MTGRTFTVELPAGLPLLNANRRIHWRRRAELTKDIRSTAWMLTRARGIPGLARAQVVCEYLPPDRRRRDVHNLYPSAKAAVDGLVDAGVLPDDSDRYLVGPDMRLGEIKPKGQLVLHITELEVARG